MSASWPLQTLSELTLAERDGRTVLTIRWPPYETGDAERQTFASGHAGMRQGTAGMLDQLDRHLEKSAAWAGRDRIAR